MPQQLNYYTPAAWNRRLAAHGFNHQPSEEEILDYAMLVDDRVRALCSYLGIVLWYDERKGYVALPSQARRA